MGHGMVSAGELVVCLLAGQQCPLCPLGMSDNLEIGKSCNTTFSLAKGMQPGMHLAR